MGPEGGELEGPLNTTDGSRAQAPLQPSDSDRVYERVRRAMAERLDTPDFAAPLVGTPEPFRLAETPVLFSPALRDRCHRAAIEILEQMRQPEVIAACTASIPEAFRVPGTIREPHTLAIDFALVSGAGWRDRAAAHRVPGLPLPLCHASGAGRHLDRNAR